MSNFREVTFSPIDRIDNIEADLTPAATINVTRGGGAVGVLQHHHTATPSASHESTTKNGDCTAVEDSGNSTATDEDVHSSSVYGASLNFVNSIVGAGIIGQ
jgi:hypothetical protein